jgi:fatty-acyl-CoA synthase
MSTFTDQMYGNAATSARGLVTGSLDAPVRRSWGEVHQQARKMAGALANAGVGPGSVVAVLAGDPADVAPLGQANRPKSSAFVLLGMRHRNWGSAASLWRDELPNIRRQ